MPSTPAKITAVFAISAILAACGGAPPEVRRGKDSREEAELFAGNTSAANNRRASLQVPPDLLASSNEKVRENVEDAEKSPSENVASVSLVNLQTQNTASRAPVEEVLPEIIGASIERDSARAWLKVDAEAEVVWQKLTEFWEFQKIQLVTRTPRAGLMETDWFTKDDLQKKGGVGQAASDLLAALTSSRTALDKFTLRLERVSPDGTHVYVSHRRKKRVATEYANQARPNEYEWVEEEQDAEKVAQLLQAMRLLFERA